MRGAVDRSLGPLRLSGRACAIFALTGCPQEHPGWRVSSNGSIVEVAYRRDQEFSQYAALHLESGYFRMNYGPGSGWGTSVVLIPSFWAGGILNQGIPVEAGWQLRSRDLAINLQGTLAGLSVRVELLLSPPGRDSLRATVRVTTSGDVPLDARPGEAFKLVMLSSMRVAADRWDALAAFVGDATLPIPAAGWIASPQLTGTRFGLRGGTSAWKRNAPTIEIRLDEPATITGWVTPSVDPNDDNVGFWAAADQIVRSWRYTIVARP